MRREPQLYDYVYLAGWNKSMFQIISAHHNMDEKYPVYEAINIPTLKNETFLHPVQCTIDEIYGVPFSDIEFHFPNPECWDIEYGLVDFCGYTFKPKTNNWEFLSEAVDIDPIDMLYLHDLQQYHRGVWGEELDMFKKFKPLNDKL